MILFLLPRFFEIKMQRFSLILFFILISSDLSMGANDAQQKKGKTWVLLLSGPDFYPQTYAFEANLFRMYQLLVEGGISPDNIITVAADSAAWFEANPLAGVVIHGEEFLHNYTRDYYLDVNIDYSADVGLNASQIFGILSGDQKYLKGVETERVINSGPDDNILIYHVGWGDYGSFCTNTWWEDVYAEEFIPFLQDLKAKKRFKKMLYIGDVDLIGSFFDDYLDTDQGIYAITNTGRYEEIEFCFFNKQVRAYTATQFSFALLNYLEYLVKTKKILTETVFDLFYGVRTAINSYSKTNIYGELTTANTKITEFFGDFKSQTPPVNNNQINPPENINFAPASGSRTQRLLNDLQSSLAVADTATQIKVKKQINNIATVSSATKTTFKSIIAKVLEGTQYDAQDVYKRDFRLNKDQLKCARASTKAAFEYCFPEQNTPVVTEHMHVFSKMCNMGIEKSKITKTMESVCNKQSQPLLLVY